MPKRSRFLMSALLFGFAFLYVPILTLIVYSFNDSRLVTVWSGFSTKWYAELLQNETILNAAWVSLRVATMSATLAVVLGSLAAIAVVRVRRFPTRQVLPGLLTSPMVMPDVITGLALLLMFVAMEQLIGWPAGRGLTTLTMAHTTLALAYVFVIVRSRLNDFDMSLEEAALDLGAKPLTVFFQITLPIISPSLLAGWLLAFTLSLDDVVIASFVSGAGSTTLPMLVFSSVRVGVTPEINALATIIVLAVSIGVVVAGTIMRPRNKGLRRI